VRVATVNSARVLAVAAVLAVSASACSATDGVRGSAIAAAGSRTLSLSASSPTPHALERSTFITVTAFGVPTTLQLRSLADGHAVKNLIVANAKISAVWESDGSLLVAQTTPKCITSLERLDPVTGHTRPVRTVAQDVVGMALSPDGTQLAYMTYPVCPPVSSGKIVGPRLSPPSVLEVLTLANGTTHSTNTDTGHSPPTLVAPTWSPDGQTLAMTAIYSVGDDRVMLLDAQDPQLGNARVPPAPPPCHYDAEAWPAAGIVVAEMCGTTGDRALAPVRLLQLNGAAAATSSWPLPDCTGGVTSVADRSTGAIVFQADIGYSGCRMTDPSSRLARIMGSEVKTITDLPGLASVQLVG